MLNSTHWSVKNGLVEASTYGPDLPARAVSKTATDLVWLCLVCKNKGQIVDRSTALAARALAATSNAVFNPMKLPPASYEIVRNAKIGNVSHNLQTHFKSAHMMCDDSGVGFPEAVKSFHEEFPLVKNDRRVTAAPGTMGRRDREDDETVMQSWLSENSKQVAVINLFAAHGLAFSQINSLQWKAVLELARIDSAKLNSVMLRENMMKISNDRVKQHLEAIARSHGCVSLAADAGTKVHRYLAVMVHAVGFKPMLFELLDEKHLLASSYNEEDFVDEQVETSVRHRHTKENYVTCLSRICERLLVNHRVLVTSIVTDNCASISGAVEQVKFGPATSLGVINGRCVCHGINLLVAMLCKHYKLIVDAFEFANSFVASLPQPLANSVSITRLISTRWASSRDYLLSVYVANADTDKHQLLSKAGVNTHKTTDNKMRRLDKAVKMLDKSVEAIRISEADDANQLDALESLSVMSFHEADYGLDSEEDPDDEDKKKKVVVFKEEGTAKDVVADIWTVETLAEKFDEKVHARLISVPLVLTAHFCCALDRQQLSPNSNEEYDDIFIPQIICWMTKSRFVTTIVHFLNLRYPRLFFTMAQLDQELKKWHSTDLSELVAENQKSFTAESFDKVLAKMNALGLPLLARVVEIIKNTPASEASAERGFSDVNTIVSCLRRSLAPIAVAMQAKYRWFELMKSAKRKEKIIIQEGEVAVERGAAFAITISKVIDMAVEKAEQVLINRKARIASKQAKAYCEGPVQNSGKKNCTSFNSYEELAKHHIKDKLFTLIQCSGECRRTRCHSCWALTVRPTKEEAAAFSCSACRANERDDWFFTKVKLNDKDNNNNKKNNNNNDDDEDDGEQGVVDWNPKSSEEEED